MQKIYVTEKDFKEIRAKGGLYVDKTKYIYNLFRDDKYFFLARPRRFGKSLLCATLSELFKGNRDVFKGLWIDSSDWSWQSYPVINLDMSKVAAPTATAADTRKGIVDLLLSNAKKLGIADLVIDTPYLMFQKLIEKTKEITGKTVVIIIDEYDKPLLDVIDDTPRHIAIHKELSAFYSQLKPAEDNLRFVLITGVFKFTQTSIFSGLNNLNDITFDMSAAELVGYTEHEIRTFFAKHLAALAEKNNTSTEDMIISLRKQYNGYKFGLDIDSQQLSGGVYNPFALNYVFEKQHQTDTWFTSGSPTALIKKLAEKQFKALTPQSLTIAFNRLNESCSPDDITALSLLYYAGYVTLKQYADTKVTLDFPNAEVAEAFVGKLLPLILEKSTSTVATITDDIRNALLNQQIDLLKDLLNDALAPASYLTFKKPNSNSATAIPQENLFQIAFYYLFIGSRLKTVMEDGTIRGRIDISVELKDVVYLFEFKMDESAASAIEQIKERDYARKFRESSRKIYAVGVSISSINRTATEITYEFV